MKYPSSELGLPPNLQHSSKGNKMRRIFASLAMASIMMLGVSTAAHAQSMGAYTCTEGGNPPPPGTYPGSLTLTEPGSCTIGDVSATGSLSIGAGGTIMVGALSGSSVEVQSTGGSTTVSSINSSSFVDVYGKDATNTNYFDVNIGGNISAVTSTNIIGKNITSSVPLTSATIESHGGGTVNVVDLTGAVYVTNDSGDINIAGKAGDSTTPTVYIAAGQSLGVGNISITGATLASSEVQMGAGANIGTGTIAAPYVQINANSYGVTSTSTFLLGGGGTNGSGNISAVPASGNYGTIQVTNGATGAGAGSITVGSASAINIPDGGGSYGGGFLYLEGFGGTITMPTGTIAVNGGEAAIDLYAKEVDTVDGTTISANYTAGGQYHYLDIDADIFRYTGTVVLSANGSGLDSASGDQGSVYMQGYTTTGATQVQIIGTAGATLDMGADGDHTFAQVYADAISFSYGSVRLHAQGTTDHQVLITNANPGSGTDTFTFSGGSFFADAIGSGGDGGTITIAAGATNINASSFTANADGPNAGGGDGSGGTISITFNGTANVYSTPFSVTADGSILGIGTGGTVNFTSPTVSLSNSLISANADGGSGTSNAGTINANITGNWGLTSSTISANSNGTGAAGHINVTTSGNLTFANTGTAVGSVTATGNGDTSPTTPNLNFNIGGSMTEDAATTLTADSAQAARAGEIALNFGQTTANSTLALNGKVYTRGTLGSALGGSISANSATGGNITGTSPDIENSNAGGAGISLNTGTAGTGNSINFTGATILAYDLPSVSNVILQSTGSISVANSLLLQGYFKANGSSVTIGSNQSLASLTVAQGGASGGNISLSSPNTVLIIPALHLSQASLSATGNIILQGQGVTVAAGTDSGDDYVSAGQNISISSVNTDIDLGADIKSDNLITLQGTGNANIVTNGGYVLPQTDGASNTLIATTNTGNIGNSGNPLLTEVANLSAATTVTGSVNILNSTDNTLGLQVLSLHAANDITLESNMNISVANSLSFSLGNIEIFSDGGNLTFTNAISATSGSISLYTQNAAGSIGFASGSSVTATNGSIEIYNGSSPPAQNAGTAPSNTNSAVFGGGLIYWGNPTITGVASGANNEVCTDGSTITFQANGNASLITINSSTFIAQSGGTSCP